MLDWEAGVNDKWIRRLRTLTRKTLLVTRISKYYEKLTLKLENMRCSLVNIFTNGCCIKYLDSKLRIY